MRHSKVAIDGDQSWSDRFKRPGFDNRVLALTTYQDQLIAGGDFSLADSTTVLHVARWDGTAWQALGSGVSDAPETYPSVSALLPFDNDLVVGGTFQQAGELPTNCIARWNGIAWQGLGGGMTLTNPTGGDVPSVQCLIEFEGNLLAGGLFDRVDGMPSPALALWNGQSWLPFGTTPVREVHALAIHGGALIAACSYMRFDQVLFSGVVRWNGASWTPVGAAFIGPVRALAVYQGELIAGAAFGAQNIGPASHLARWDGTTWQALGSGLRGQNYFGALALVVHDDRLVVGGAFEQAGEVSTSSIAAWNGTNWAEVGAGMHLPTFGPMVHALHVHQGFLIAGGDFSRAGSVAADFVARWNGDAWDGLGAPGLGMDGLVLDLMVHDGQIFAAGAFQQAGSVDANHVVRWEEGWIPMGQGLRRDSTSARSLVMHEGHLHAAISTAVGDSSISFIARWSGSEWTQVSPSTNSWIGCMVEYAGDLVAGGWFTRAGNVPASGIARWNGSEWSPLGAGVSASYRPEVSDLEVFGGDLVAAGSFDHAGAVGAANIARWDGDEWSPLGTGLTGQLFANAYDLASYGDGLVAVGAFDRAGGVAVNSVAFWNGTQWSSLGEGPEGQWDPPILLSVAASGQQLVVSGLFERADGEVAQNIARWDGNSWTALGSGLGDYAITLAFLDDDLWAGGWFRTAGSTQSVHIARWTDPIVPVLIQDFVAVELNGDILLRWRITEPEQLSGVDVERAMNEAGPWATLTQSPLDPAPAMSFVDSRPDIGGKTWYRLRCQAANGEPVFAGPLAFEASTLDRDALRLHPPMVVADGGPIRIRFELGRTAPIELTILDVQGRIVRRLEQGVRSPGEHEVDWDRRTTHGRPVVRGIYFVHLRAGSSAVSRKLVRAW